MICTEVSPAILAPTMSVSSVSPTNTAFADWTPKYWSAMPKIWGWGLRRFMSPLTIMRSKYFLSSKRSSSSQANSEKVKLEITAVLHLRWKNPKTSSAWGSSEMCRVNSQENSSTAASPDAFALWALPPIWPKLARHKQRNVALRACRLFRRLFLFQLPGKPIWNRQTSSQDHCVRGKCASWGGFWRMRHCSRQLELECRIGQTR